MPEYTKRLVERLVGRPAEGVLSPRPAWRFGRSEEAGDPFDAPPQPTEPPSTGPFAGTVTPRPARPFEPPVPAASLLSRIPGLVEPRAHANATLPPPSPRGLHDPGAGRPEARREGPDEAGSGAPFETLEPRGETRPAPRSRTGSPSDVRTPGQPESASLPVRVSAADRRDVARIEAPPTVPAPRIQSEGPSADRKDHEPSDRRSPERLSPPPVALPPTAPAEPRLVIGRLLVEVTPPAAPLVRTPPPPAPPAPPRPFRAGAPSSALFRRPLGLGQG